MKDFIIAFLQYLIIVPMILFIVFILALLWKDVLDN